MSALLRLLALLVLLRNGLPACAASEPPTTIRFRDVTAAAGIRFVHTDGGSGQRHIVETVASGMGMIDYNSDGFPDLLFLNGRPLPGTPPPKTLPTHALYRNNRDGTFTDVTLASGVGVPGYGMGCAVADFDNDGHEDICISNFGPPHLLRNNGDGTFSDVTAKAGLAQASSALCVGAGCVFFDYDRDGFVDLYLGQYLNFDPATNRPFLHAGVPVYANPRTYPPIPSRLFHNEGNGTFRDVSQASGIGLHAGYAMGVVSADFDDDGWPDLFIGNDVMGNFLFHNRRNGAFAEIGLPAGVTYDQYGDPMGTMGANVGDFDGDGRFDIFISDYQDQVNTLFRNLGKLQFRDVTVETGAGTGSRPLVTWGCGFVDFDNDGVPELFTAAGHLQDTVEQYDRNTTYRQRSLLLQRRSGRFVDVTREVGGALLEAHSRRAALFGDLNNDGRLDLVLLNTRERATVLFNETPPTHHWVTLKLTGSRSNRSAIGASARLTAGRRTLVDEVRSGRGYQSADDLRLHFGLGTHAAIDRLEVRWPSGLTNVWTRLPVDRILRLTEGQPAVGETAGGATTR